MSAPIKNTIVVLVLVLVPLALGILVVGTGAPAGRNSSSPTRVGHKVFFLLLEQLGYRTALFERGLETPPRERAVLIAVEPGPALLRDGGRYAQGLLDWISQG